MTIQECQSRIRVRCTALLLVGAMAPALSGAIIYTNIPDTTMPADGVSRLSFDLGAGGSPGGVEVSFGAPPSSLPDWDFSLTYSSGEIGMPQIVLQTNRRVAAPIETNYVINFVSGATLDGTVVTGAGLTKGINGFGANDEFWAAGTTGFLGLRDNFNHYAWARMSYNSDMSMTLYDFAYEDSGGAIAAGAIPEPSTTAIWAALAAIGVGYRFRRGRASGHQEM